MKITDIQPNDPIIYVGVLTETQKNQLINQQYTSDSYFNPIQDADDNWIISIEEMRDCTAQEFLWVKELNLIIYNPKLPPPFPPVV